MDQDHEQHTGKRLSPSLGDELAHAGATTTLTWTPDGVVRFGPAVKKSERDAVMAVIEAHDPDAVAPPSDRELALQDLESLAASGPEPVRELAAVVRRLVGGLLLVALAATPAWAGVNRLTLSWTNNAPSSQSTRIERRPGLCVSQVGLFAELATISPILVEYVDQPLSGGQSYCYRVRAEEAGFFSDYSNEADGTALGLPTPGTLDALIVR